jgi:hypothetical protein
MSLSVPRVPWEVVRRRLARDWRPGEHVLVVGKTGSGKSHLLAELVSIRRFVVVVGTKTSDPLLDSLEHEGYRRIRSVDEIVWADGVPVHEQLLLWPGASKGDLRRRLSEQADTIRETLTWGERSGRWTIVLDELLWLTRRLGLSLEVEAAFFGARSAGVSILGAAQRPRHVPLIAMSSARYLVALSTPDEGDRDRLGELGGGMSRKAIARAVAGLDYERHEALFLDAARNEAAITIAPPRPAARPRGRATPGRTRIAKRR